VKSGSRKTIRQHS